MKYIEESTDEKPSVGSSRIDDVGLGGPLASSDERHSLLNRVLCGLDLYNP